MRKNLPKNLEAKLLVESKHTCNICWIEKNVQIHHINGDHSDDSEDNLIVIGLECHSKVHTKRDMARNYIPETLRLYKATWIDLIKRYPFESIYINEKNDIKIIENILSQSNRRALYYPYHLELPMSMFKSISDYRINIQKSGYKLMINKEAKNSIEEIYDKLVTIEFLFPSNNKYFEDCLPGMLGKNGIQLLEINRQIIIYHVNKLGKLIGYIDDIIDNDNNLFARIGINSEMRNKRDIKCFKNYQNDCKLCKECDFKEECREATLIIKNS
jgi:hypothetical protein